MKKILQECFGLLGDNTISQPKKKVFLWGMEKKRKKPKLPRGKMPPPTKVHKDKKKEKNKRWCRNG